MEAEKGEGSSLVRRQKDVNEARGGVCFFFFCSPVSSPQDTRAAPVSARLLDSE